MSLPGAASEADCFGTYLYNSIFIKKGHIQSIVSCKLWHSLQLTMSPPLTAAINDVYNL